MRTTHYHHQAILSGKFQDEFHEGDLILKEWHFPVKCPDCDYVYISVDHIRRGHLSLDLDIPIGFYAWTVTRRCPDCATLMNLYHQEPKPITQREVDACGFILDDVPGADKLGFFGFIIDVFHWIFSFADPDQQNRFLVLCFIVITSPFWWHEITEWIDVLFFY